MVWQIEVSDAAKRTLAKMDRVQAKRITRYLRERVEPADNPRALGLALLGAEMEGLWRYRVGDYRIIARIEDAEIRILVIRIAHRREVYR